MRSLVASLALGLGVLGISSALPQQANAAGPWHDHYNHGHYVRYYGPGLTCVQPVIMPVVVSPVVPPVVVSTPIIEPAFVAPYASFSYGYRGPWYGGYRSGYYYHHR